MAAEKIESNEIQFLKIYEILLDYRLLPVKYQRWVVHERFEQ